MCTKGIRSQVSINTLNQPLIDTPGTSRWTLDQLLEGHSIDTSPRMARHIRELFMCAGAKIQNRLEKSANNNKEYGQKAATSAYVLLFHGHTKPSGQVVAYGN